MSSAQFSFQSGILSPSQRKGIIALFHKGGNKARDNLDNWRPISLLNADYKLITKALAARLATVVPKIVGESQVGFVKGRNVANLIREIDDILEHHREHEVAGYVVSLDFRKAFDCLSTPFLFQTLKKMGFGPYFLQWVRVILNNRTATVKNGGHISEPFEIQRGLRQGCPISPLLFILAAEIMAKKIEQDADLHGLEIPGGNVVKIRQYADDTTLFLKDAQSIQSALTLLRTFSKCSGLDLNTQKSNILPTLYRIIDDEPIGGIKKVDKVKILGITFSNTKSAGQIEDNWQERIDKIIRLCGSWSRRNLSIFGKVLILKTFGVSQLTYLMQSLTLPESVLNRLTQIFYRFIWKKRFSNRRAFEKIKRTVLNGSRLEGGLNVPNLHALQTANLLTWAEKILDGKAETWKAIPQHALRGVGSLAAFEASVDSKRCLGSSSIKNHFWKRVLETWLDRKDNTTKPQTQCKCMEVIANNKEIQINNKSIWLPSLLNKNIVRLKDVTIRGRMMTLEEFREQHGPYPRSWMDHMVLTNAIPHGMIQPCQHLGPDESYPTFNGSKIGTIGRRGFLKLIKTDEICSCTYRWQRALGVDLEEEHWAVIHNTSKEVRIQCLCWKMLHNIYPTNILLHKMGEKTSNLCEKCGVLDTMEHFFAQCREIQPLWREIERLIRTQINVGVSLGAKEVIFGCLDKTLGQKERRHINMMIQIGKLIVSKFKYGRTTRWQVILEIEIERRKSQLLAR